MNARTIADAIRATAFATTLVAASCAWAQPPTSPPATATPPDSAPATPNTETPPGGIARGVVPPPRGVDPEIVTPPPADLKPTMPVIKPPTSAR